MDIPLAVFVLGFGIFSMTSSEFMMSGLMPQVAEGLGVSIVEVGYLISTFAIGMVVGGPLLTFALLRLPRKKALLVLAAIFVAGDVLGALAPSYPVMVAARLITGVASSAFFGTSLAVAADLVPENQRGRASSIVLGGLMIGTVIGLPLATAVGQLTGWRTSFWMIGCLTAAAGVLIASLVPRDSVPERIDARAELAAFRNGMLWSAYASSTLIIGAVFAGFSYFTPIFTQVSGFDAAAVPVLLAAYGIATVAGNVIVGRLADRWTMFVQIGGLIVLTVFLSVFALGASSRILVVVSLVAIGAVGVSMNPAMVARVMRVADGRPLVNTVHTSVINVGILLGSWIGGLTISAGLGLVAPLWTGAVFALLALVSVAPFVYSRRHGAAPRDSQRGLAAVDEPRTGADPNRSGGHV
ncbi:MFS transporter [Pseudonocardia phyllosphaerae]|uniref:MFS transporter n=1 Tax=Pseudonocardia phyllosphaerae TaxID=3390502 RepID=UPI00397A34D0